MTLPDEGPEQRWRRTVRKRPAKLKLGRLLRDFGYSELDDDVADAIEARMAGVGLAIRPSLREAAADEIVTVYRPQGADDDAPAAAAAAAAAPRPREPAAAAAPERSRSKSRRASDPDATRAISDLKGQLADARAESARLRTELDGRIAAMAEADRLARERLAEQTAVVEEQSHRLAELSGLLNETRAALAEARDEIRRALGDLPAAVVEAPVEVGGLSEEEGWLTDAEEPLPPSPVEAAVSAIASPVDDPDELAPDAGELDEPLPSADTDAGEPAADLDPLPMDDVFADDAPPGDEPHAADAEAPPADDDDLVLAPELPVAAAEPTAPAAPAQDDVFSLEPEAPTGEGLGLETEAPEDDDVFAQLAGTPAEDDLLSLEAEALERDDVFSLEAEAPAVDDVFAQPSGTPAENDLSLEAEALAQEDVFSLEAEALAQEDVFGLEAEPQARGDVFGLEAEALAQEDVFGLEAEPQARGDVFGLEAEPQAQDDVFGLEAEPQAQDDVFSLEAEPQAQDDVFSLEAEATEDDDVFGPPTEASPADDASTVEPAPATVARPPAPARRSGFFTLDATPPSAEDVPISEAGPPPASDDAAPEEPVPAEADDLTFATPAADFDEPAPVAVPEPTGWTDDAPSALPPPPPLPPSPFANELPARPPDLGEPPSRQPAKRGRMARGRGRWQGTCSVCERFPEVSRRKDLEAAGWQLDGDFPTCPQCRGLA